jgi:hypothetical protein
MESLLGILLGVVILWLLNWLAHQISTL